MRRGFTVGDATFSMSKAWPGLQKLKAKAMVNGPGQVQNLMGVLAYF